MTYRRYIFAYTIVLLLTFSVYAMEQEAITFKIGDKEYGMNVAQAQHSKTLKNLFEDIEDYVTPIFFDNFTEEVFDLVYNDLTNIPYDDALVSDEILADSINAANFLDSEKLLQKYQDLFVVRLKSIDSLEKFKKYAHLEEILPKEMQIPLSKCLCEQAASIFKMLPQSKINGDLRQGIMKDILISPDESKMWVQSFDHESMEIVDLKSKEIVWKKNISVPTPIRVFSCDSSQLLLLINNVFPGFRISLHLMVFDVKTGKILLNGSSMPMKNLNILGFFSDINKIVASTEEILNKEFKRQIIIINSINSSIISKIPFPENMKFLKCFYDSDSCTVCLTGLNYLLTLDLSSDHILKIKKDTGLDHYSVFPGAKKIITLSRELIAVESIADNEEAVTWALKKPFSEIPTIDSFSRSNRIFSIISPKDKMCAVFNISNNQDFWVEQTAVRRTWLSPESYELFIQTDSSDIELIDFESKKKLWTKNIQKKVRDVCFISEEILACLSKSKKKKSIIIDFLDKKTGERRESYNLVIPDLLGINPLSEFKFINIIQNFLYLKGRDLLCLDISPLLITSFLNQHYIPLNQSLLINYIFKMLQNNDNIKDVLDCEWYDELPRAIKSLVENHH